MSIAGKGPRFSQLELDTMSDAQKIVAQKMIAGPRKGMKGPFNVLLRHPDLCDKVQALGAVIRFHNAIPDPLKEMAIIMTGRHWTASYEFQAHRRMAVDAGLAPAICDAIADGRRPEAMSADEAIIYDFCSELLATGQVSDGPYARAEARWGEKGVVDLTATVGYYCVASLVLNVARHPLPEGAVPLKHLK